MTGKDKEKAEQETSKGQPDQDITETPDSGASEIIDMKEAIKLLDTTRSTFYRWVREGRIKGMKVGRQWRFYREDIDRFLKGQEPLIELPADIGPLIKTLCEYAKQLGAEDVSPPDESEPSVVKAADLMILIADRMNASDIHLAPHLTKAGEEAVATLRYRVDGVLHTIAEIDTRLLPAIISRWKVMANCDVHEKQKPQDGRILLKFPDSRREVDLRASFLPAGLGESLTVRIIASAVWFGRLKLDEIDFSPRDKEKIIHWVDAPRGMVVVSGPTGSGKTTVLYACLNHIARPEVKILTAESPVEFYLPWAVQIQVSPETGFTFPAALRAILRSDPDVIMVGEIRDLDTLAMAQECALTGHLVMAPMHAADAAGVLKRMVELGSTRYIIGESMNLVIAQRLVRKLCPDCSVEESPLAKNLNQAAKLARAGGLDWNSLPKKFRAPVGCEKCKHTGYRGRNIIAEVLEVTPEIIAVLSDGTSLEKVRKVAVEQGMTTVVADGIRRAAMGETSLAEVMRIVSELI